MQTPEYSNGEVLYYRAPFKGSRFHKATVNHVACGLIVMTTEKGKIVIFDPNEIEIRRAL